MILTLINSKGGVGKTTSAVNLAAALAELGHRTLLLDLDQQASASFSLGIPRDQLAPSSADVLLHDLPIREAIRPTSTPKLDIVTASIELANADIVLAPVRGRESRLAGALAPIRGEYAYILIDCPPSLSLLPINALLASDWFMVPLVPHYLALEGLVSLLDAVSTIQREMGATAKLLGLLLTMVDVRARSTTDLIAMIRDHYGSAVFDTEIRTNIRLAEAPSFGRTALQHDPTSTGALAYTALAREVVKKNKKHK
jgi:chromosome partitioning protein